MRAFLGLYALATCAIYYGNAVAFAQETPDSLGKGDGAYSKNQTESDGLSLEHGRGLEKAPLREAEGHDPQDNAVDPQPLGTSSLGAGRVDTQKQALPKPASSNDHADEEAAADHQDASARTQPVDQTAQAFALDPALETRARAIANRLTCDICEGRSIAEVPAPFAQELFVVLKDRLAAGDSDENAVAYLTNQYEARVFAKPAIEPNLIFLWGFPLVIVVVGGVFAFFYIRSIAHESAPLAKSVIEIDSEKRLGQGDQ